VKITNLFPRGIVFTAAKRFSCINLPANNLRRNYKTSLISADPLCFDLRPVMAAIISCGFVRRIVTIDSVENSSGRYHGDTQSSHDQPLYRTVHKRKRILQSCPKRQYWSTLYWTLTFGIIAGREPGAPLAREANSSRKKHRCANFHRKIVIWQSLWKPIFASSLRRV